MTKQVILADVLAHGLRVVFCGTAPSDVSARLGAYYANPSNRFWPALYAVGLLPVPLLPRDFPRLPEYGLGLTDLAKHAKGVDSALKPGDFDAEALWAKIDRYQPRWLAFTSKKAAAVALGLTTGQIAYGPQDTARGATRLFVLPSPSAQAQVYWDISHWHLLARLSQAQA
ncbi:MAG: mismatch-specific DNA-glycosylase [Anaerolineae bacterium]|nr:mismatch-specific DNA-glycosylase [Anaerolineae bacterium]MDW8171431.1 mismatch-specific DNA-glycosylase [Anaerolineae bacterium]